MRLVSTLLCGVLVLFVLAEGARQTRAALRADPDRIPDVLRAEGEPAGLWIFTRAGCRACAMHLEALRLAARDLSPAERHAALQRVRLVGDTHPPCAVQHLSAATRRAAGVERTPTTWRVDAEGRIRDVWRGPRNPAAWRRALLDMATESEAR